MTDVTRRALLQVTGGSLAVLAVPTLGQGTAAAATPTGLTLVDALPTGVSRTWLGPQYWANRLADWQLRDGRIESRTAGAGGRTVGVVTRSLRAGASAGSVSVRTGTIAAGTGFSGFLVGAGAGQLDWRAAALVMGASGRGGGLLAVYDSDGAVRFRDHTDEARPFGYAVLPVTGRRGPAPARSTGEDVTLRLDVVPAGGRFDLVLTATSASGELLSTCTRCGVPDSDLVGGLSLVSSAPDAGSGVAARHWFRELATGGGKVAVSDHSAGPVLGTLYSLSAGVLKLSAQFLPIGAGDPQRATLLVRPAGGGGAWRTAATAPVGAGWLALFRVTGWDSSRDWDYRVRWAAGTAQAASYDGQVRAEPTGPGALSIAMINCTVHSFRNLELGGTGGRSRVPGSRFLGLYTTDNLYFPYAELAGNVRAQRPDLLAVLGDQYYEHRPSRPDRADAELDVLYKFGLWLLSFRDLTRDTPAVCLVDDHDVYHGNLWGWAGAPSPHGNQNYGGYQMPADWVNVVQRIQCAHNPDAFDPTPVLQGIGVYYCAFSYGGVSFAVLEDRKWKDTNKYNRDLDGHRLPEPRQLLGARQEAFLAQWKDLHPGQPKVCLTQTVFGCLETDPDGGPVADSDTNAKPATGRRTAVRLLRDAHALVLSGDQHLTTLVRHGLDAYDDGPVQFTAPAAGSGWQRWFEPAQALPNARGPHTGDYTDGAGNPFRVLAVANPVVSFAQVRAVQPINDIGDRELKREGYGLVEVDTARRQFRISCWPWDTDPTAADARQYPGWPYVLPFSDA